MAQGAADRAEKCAPIHDRWRIGSRSRGSEEAHVKCKLFGVAYHLFGVRGVHIGVVFRDSVEQATGGFVALVSEKLIGDAHFDVVGFGRKDLERLVLSLPSHSSHRAVVVAPIGTA